MSATLRYDPGQVPPAADRLQGPLRHAVDGHLEAALGALALPAGRWCLARLDLTLPLDLDRPDAALARDWARAVAAAVERTVREDHGAAVHYRNDADLLADAVTGLATGHLERLWAWRQTGLVLPGDPAPGAVPGEAVLAVLERHPRRAAATVLRAAEQCGAAALDRALGRRGWQRLAALVTGAATGNAPPPPGDTAPDPATHALARTLLAGSRFAALLRAARLRPAEPTAAAWAVLVLAETDPVALHRPGARPGLHRLLTGALGTAGGTPARLDAAQRPSPSQAEPQPVDPARPPTPGPTGPETRPGSPGGAAAGAVPARPATHAVGPGGRAPAQNTPAEQGTVRTPEPDGSPLAEAPLGPAREPADGPPPEGVPTDWAGLLFLLATAAGAGLPDRVLDDPALAARPLPWVLHAAARALVPAVPVDDPAALAFAGLDRTRAPRVLDAEPPTPAEQARIDALATAWARATVARLASAATPAAAAAATAPAPPAPSSATAPGSPSHLPAAGPGRGSGHPGPGTAPPTTAPDAPPVPRADSGHPEPAARPAPQDPSAADVGSPALPPGRAAPAGSGAPVAVEAGRIVAGVARRRGRVVAEAGWIEVVLAAPDADPWLRRAGLDLDPGWVGWLGAVVRYRYV
ncbi:hypothetical protein ACFV7Q_28365 [Streptomyces sp. NPDC059851]|uniref:hypothetical protein n=1 Tax=Streptomyces sp. NPDC059851 TaxID=3346971 RepID=UPI0036610BA6